MLGSLSKIDRMIHKIERWLPPSSPQFGELALSEWLNQPLVSPFDYDWSPAYIQLIIRELDRITRGENDKLMIMLPPRHFKSSLVTIRYPVWRMEMGTTRVIVGCYSQTLANKFSRASRRIARARIGLSTEIAKADEWETANGSWYKATGVGGSVTGSGGDLILIDDPVKSREEANSPVYREKVWDWYTNDISTRKEPGAATILTMTRWHEDDLAGRILSSEDGPNWTVICLPAICERSRVPEQYLRFEDYQTEMLQRGLWVDEVDPLGRAEGEALHPGRYPVEALNAQKVVMGSWGFSALYQQKPMPSEGGMFKRSWLPVEASIPRDLLDNRYTNVLRVRYWDKAGTQDAGDYTVGVRMAKVITPIETIFYIEDVVRGQWASGERDRIIINTAQSDGIDTYIGVEQEPGSSGKDATRSLINLLAGYKVSGDKVSGSKEIRAEPMAAQAEVGYVRLIRGEWNAAFLDEISSFPAGQHDDQIDAASGAFNKLVPMQPPKKAESYQG